MDQTQLQQQIALYYSKLSPDMQEMFSSMKWMDAIGEISSKYGLTEEQKGSLGAETTLVLLGMISAEEYERNLEAEISISADLIQKMVGEINTSILDVIKPKLSEAYNKNNIDVAEKNYGGVKELDERFAKLPKEVQVAISESGYQAALYEIASKHKLSINHMGALDEATTKVMLGIIHPDRYEAELQANIAIPKEEIIEIVDEVNEKVLKNIKEILKKHWGGNDTEDLDDDEVPIPPYAMPKVVTSSTPKASDESKIYSDSGIEIMKDADIQKPKENIVTPEKEIIDTKPPENIPTMPMEEMKDDLLEKSIIGDKLAGATSSSTSTTDYSLPKVSKDGVTSRQHDPYHEPIE